MDIRLIIFDKPEEEDDLFRTVYVQEYHLITANSMYVGVGIEWKWVHVETRKYEMQSLKEIKQELLELYPRAEVLDVSLVSEFWSFLRPLQMLCWKYAWFG